MLVLPKLSLWGFRTRPPAQTWASGGSLAVAIISRLT